MLVSHCEEPLSKTSLSTRFMSRMAKFISTTILGKRPDGSSAGCAAVCSYVYFETIRDKSIALNLA